MEIDLIKEKKLLEAQINDLESRIAPLQKELKEKRERLVHVKALLPEEQSKPVNPIGDKLEKGFWANAARELDLFVGGDSAHRVIKRKAPEFHVSIPHQCDIDGRSYP